MTLHSLLLALSGALATAMISSVWQSLLMFLLLTGAMRLLPGLGPAARSGVWTAVLLCTVLLPVLLLSSPARAQAHEAAMHLEESFSVALVGLWAAASVFRAIQITSGAINLHGILQRATPVQPSDAVAKLLGSSSRSVQLCTSGEVNRPSVAGFVKPRILLPPDLLKELDGADLQHIVLHELEHLRRYDDWINLLQQLSLVVLPLNPALFWLNRRLSLEREVACDDRVLAVTQARGAYAACLARVAEASLLRRGMALALGALGHGRRRSELALRVQRILYRPDRPMSGMRARLAATLLVVATVAAGNALAHGPDLVTFVSAAPLAAPSAAPSLSASAGIPAVAPQTISARPQAVLVRTAISPARPPARFPAQFIDAVLTPHHTPARVRGPHPAHLRRIAERWPTRNVARPSAITVQGWARGPKPILPEVRLVSVLVEEDQVWFSAVPAHLAWRSGWFVVQL